MTPFSMAALCAERDDIPSDRTAVIHSDQRLTYAEMDRQADLVAAALAAADIGRGDHVGVLGVNSATSIDLLIGCARAGAIGVHYNWRRAHYKRPTAVHIVDYLPRNATGKVLREELRNDPSWHTA